MGTPNPVKLTMKGWPSQLAWWCIPIIAALKRLMQEDSKFESGKLYKETLSQKNRKANKLISTSIAFLYSLGSVVTNSVL